MRRLRRQPSDCQLSLQGYKSFTWIETSRHRDKELKSNEGATGGWSDRNSERGADLGGSKASELRVSYLSDVPQIHGEAAEQVG
jgi:hypothetical protein